MFQDGADHRRLRRAVTPAFMPEALIPIRARLRLFVDELLDELAPSAFDVPSELAHPIAAFGVCALTGVDSTDGWNFGTWTAAISDYLIRDYREDVARDGQDALNETANASERALASASSEPGGSTTAAALLRGAVATGSIELEEAVATLSLLIYAGYITTKTFLSNLVFGLLTEADGSEWRDSDGAATLIESTLRTHPSVPQVARAARGTSTLGPDVTAGDLVLVRLGRRRGRTDDSALPFGHGPHYCLGAPVARLEAEVLLDRLTSRFHTGTVEAARVANPSGEPREFEHLSVRLWGPR
jgi:cytochrome P450